MLQTVQATSAVKSNFEAPLQPDKALPQHVFAIANKLQGGSARYRLQEELSYSEMSVKPEALVALLRKYSTERVDSLRRDDILPLNISDFDGTLIRDSSGAFKIDYAIDHGFILPVIRKDLNGMLERFGLPARDEALGDTSATVGADVRAVKEAFEVWVKRTDLTPEEKNDTTKAFYQMCSWIFAGHTKEEMQEFTERVLVETGYGVNYFSGARELINALREIGIETMLVSATFQPVVEVAARYFGIPAQYVKGMNLEVDEQGRYTTTMKEPVTFRDGKVRAAHELMTAYLGRDLGEYRPALAMGDSPSKTDEQLLALAEVAVAVEPQTPKDAEHAKKLFNKGRAGFFLDFTSTIGGEPALKFRSELEVQEMPRGKFL